MYWYAVTRASRKISTEKWPVLPKTLMKSMVPMGLALILYHNIEQFANYDISGNQSMNVQNRSSVGVLEKTCNLGQNIQSLFRF